MGVITSVLRKAGYYVEQEDLLVKVKFREGSWKVNPAILTIRKYVQRCLNKGCSDKTLDKLADEILRGVRLSFDIIGFSILSYPQFLFALLLAEKIKKISNATIVFGGAFITLQGNMFFSRYRFIDFMIRGDGQIPFLNLLEYIEGKRRIEEVPSLTFRENGQMRENPRGVYSVEDMPLPDFEGLPLDLYRDDRLNKGKLILPYQISRGCPHQCSFCAKDAFGKVEIKSLEKISKELKEYSKIYNSNYFWFCDWTFNVSYKHAEQLCDMLVDEEVNIKWCAGVSISIRDIDSNLIKKMKRSGCVRLTYGIESGSDKNCTRLKEVSQPN